MTTFLYRCPNTDKNVQNWIAEEASSEHADTYLPVQCHACRQLHYVSPATGKVLGNDDDE